MSWTFVIPYYGAPDANRDAALAVVQANLAQHYPWPVALGGSGALTKGEAVDALVAATVSEGLVLHDADVLVAPPALRSSMLAVESGAHGWAMPHSSVARLSRRGTLRIGQLDLTDLTYVPAAMLERPPHPAPHGGGITVLSRAAYDAVGGIDPRFVGWGGEDISFARALDTLAGVGLRGDAMLWHLWHPRQERRRGNRASPESEALASRYLDAVGNPEAMTEVVNR